MSLSRKAREVVDGKGVKRVLRNMLVGKIGLRMADDSDCSLLWKWANDPLVRKSAFHSNTIEWDTHTVWFKKKLTAPSTFIFIAESDNGQPAGQIRFDISGGIANIDYSIAREFRGLGLGETLLAEGMRRLAETVPNDLIFQGEVKEENKASRHIFQRLGFKKDENMKKPAVSKNENVPVKKITYKIP